MLIDYKIDAERVVHIATRSAFVFWGGSLCYLGLRSFGALLPLYFIKETMI